MSALRLYRSLHCQDHLLNTVLHHPLNPTQLAQEAPEVADTLEIAKALVKYVKKDKLGSF